jgi:hypothetical protein
MLKSKQRLFYFSDTEVVRNTKDFDFKTLKQLSIPYNLSV